MILKKYKNKIDINYEDNNSKIINIMDEKWNYLIILDACRYDYFLNNYKKYLNGKLKKEYPLVVAHRYGVRDPLQNTMMMWFTFRLIPLLIRKFL